MKIYSFLLFIFFLLNACFSDSTDKNAATENSDSTTLQQFSETDLLNAPTDKNELKLFLSAHFENDTVSIFIDALENYDSLKQDSALAQFYLHAILTMTEAINNAMLKPNPNYTNPEDPAEAWKWITNFYPYIKTIWACSECESEALVEVDELIKKAETTKGKIDDLFFEALKNSTDIATGNAGCDYCGYWTIGDGSALKALKQIIELEQHTQLFHQTLNENIESMFNLDYATVFGASKEKVLKEIDELLSLKNKTTYDISNLEILKQKILSNKEKMIFECKFEDFMEN